jgi:superfamily II DNA/RNA helicase
MVFVNKKDSAQNLQARLAKKDVVSNILIGGIENKDRDRIIDDFRKNCFNCLISTNVLARGIDVPEVDLVINYDVPIT